MAVFVVPWGLARTIPAGDVQIGHVIVVPQGVPFRVIKTVLYAPGRIRLLGDFANARDRTIWHSPRPDHWHYNTTDPVHVLQQRRTDDRDTGTRQAREDR